MKTIKLKQNSVKFKLSKNAMILKIGIWDTTEISIDRQSFEENNSDYDGFIKLFIDILNGENIKYIEFEKDKYWITLIEELLDNNLLIELKNNTSNVQETIFLTSGAEDKNIKKYLRIINFNLYKVMSIEHFLNKDSSKIRKNKNYIVISSNPNIFLLEKLNKVFFTKKIRWSFAIQDDDFIYYSTIIPEVTGCYKCLEIGNSLRIIDYENYISFLKKEKEYSLSVIGNVNNCIYMLQNIIFYSTYRSIEGKLLTIYLPDMEINLEKLYKTSLCPLDGVKAKQVSEDLNYNANTIIDILNNEENSKECGRNEKN